MMVHGFGGASRQSGGGQQRFHVNRPHASRRDAALRTDHPAVLEGRTLFPTTVVEAGDAPRLLVSGVNSAKIGRRITKGAWAGLLVYTLTLEERATCPASCGLWRECYGNAMPMARRHRAGAALEVALNAELADLLAQRRHRRGLAVRLHVLGDFYTAGYVARWLYWMQKHPTLHAWGYTAHPADTPIGAMILLGNRLFPERWAFRTSVDPGTTIEPWQATTIWRPPEATNVPEGLICPASTEGTQACATCGLCWDAAAAGKRIAFVGHGMTKRGNRPLMPETETGQRVRLAGGPHAVAARLGLGFQAVKRWAAQNYIPPAQRPAFEAACATLTPPCGEGEGGLPS